MSNGIVLNLMKDKVKVNDAIVLLGTTASGTWLQLVAHDNLPPISRRLLCIYVALSQVFHANGAGEAVDRILQERQIYKILAENGSDVSLLFSFSSFNDFGILIP